MGQFIYQKSIPADLTADVLVIGGGPAGLCAAIAAARNGADTLLIEQNGYCGGMATAGLVAPFMTCYDSGGTTMLIRGLFEEIIDRLVAVGGAIHPSRVNSPSSARAFVTYCHSVTTSCNTASPRYSIRSLSFPPFALA